MIRFVRALGKVWEKRAYAVFMLCAFTAVSLPAQSFKSLAGFDFTDGADPQGGLVQAANGDLYGTTGGGGLNNNVGGSAGTIFKITPRGALTTVYNFCSLANCADGSNPQEGAGSGHQWIPLRDNAAGRKVRCGNGFQNHPERFVNHSLQLLLARLHGRCKSLCGSDPSEQRRLVRDNGRRRIWHRSRRLWHHLQNHSGRRADDCLYLLLPKHVC